MVFFSFCGRAFNKEYCESNIYIVIAAKEYYKTSLDFINNAVEYINDKVYPGENFKSDYEGIILKEGNFVDIVKHWIDSMNQSIEIKIDDITNIQRIKCNNSDSYRDEYLIETATEYIMLLWSTTA